MNIEKLLNNIDNYICDYYPSAFWFWNEDMTLERMDFILCHMAKDKIREVLFHPSHGLNIEYLSAEFFEKYRQGLKLCKKYNIKVYIYDDYGWPSGSLSGKFIEKYPNYVMKYLAYENGVVSIQKSNRIHDGNMGAPWCKKTPGYIDTLSKAAMQTFIEMNYNRFKIEAKDLWDQILGFFTDEPAIVMPYDKEDLNVRQALPWSEDLPKIFYEKYSYKIEDHYKELFLENYSQVKEDYFNVAINMHIEAYFKQLSEWCAKERKIFTGHVREDSVCDQIRFGGNLYKAISELHIPGVDFLNLRNPDQTYEQEMVSSIAKANGKKKVYMEAFGISPYSLSLKEMYHKFQSIIANRVNDIALMGLMTSNKGSRKRLYWSPIGPEAPWWDYYPYLRDSISRIMAFSNLGEEIRNVAILYPQYEGEQSVANLDKKGDKKEFIEKTVRSIIDKVQEKGYTFDWVFPEMLKDCKIQNNKVVFPHGTYDYFIVLSDFNYSKETLSYLNNLSNIIWDKLININLPQNPKTDFIKCDFKNKINVYKYKDAFIYSIRNLSDSVGKIDLNKEKVYIIDPINNKIYNFENKEIESHKNIYILITNEDINISERPKYLKEVDINFSFKAQKYNIAPFKQVFAYHNEKGWIDLTDIKSKNLPVLYNDYGYKNNNSFPYLTNDFYNYTNIKIKSVFNMAKLCKIGVLFEKGYVNNIYINGEKLDLSQGKNKFVWDYSNIYLDSSNKVKLGENILTYELNFAPWETDLKNEGFFRYGPMPSVDVALVGDFLYINEKIYSYSNNTKSLPIDLSKEGFQNTYGKVILEGEFEKDMNYLGLDITGSPTCEILIDNKTIGVNFTDYIFSLENIPNGYHNIKIIMTGNCASLMDYKENNKFILNKILSFK